MNRTPELIFTLVFVLGGLVAELSAQPVVPVGNQFQVNEFTTDSQTTPRIVHGAVGGFVVVWESGSQDGSADSVVARRLDGEGAPSGAEFVVNSHTTGSQRQPELSADGSGGFAVAFASPGGLATDPSQPVLFRAFDAGDQPFDDDLQVNTTTTNVQLQPSVVTTAAGEFLVAFGDYSAGLSDGNIRLRRIDAAGVGVGSDFVIDESAADLDLELQISSDGGDGFVVVWTGPSGSDGDGASVQARRVDATGQPVGSQFQVNSYTMDSQYFPSVSADSEGGFLVAWLTDPFDGGVTDYDVAVRRFDSDGTPKGVEVKVNAGSPGSSRYQPRITGDSGGGSVVVWREDDGRDIQARRVDASGTPVGNVLQVNTYTTGIQSDPSIAATPDGEFVVVWSSLGSYGTDTDGRSIQARRFAFDDDEDGVGNPVDDCTDLDGDGFGDPGFPANLCADDNCPDVANGNQVDLDGDDVGDECDLCLGTNEAGDSDGDGVCNDLDVCAGDDFLGDTDADGLCADRDCDDADPANACAIFDDGFESGGTSAWASMVP